MSEPTLTLDGDTILADGVPLLRLEPDACFMRAVPIAGHARWVGSTWPWSGVLADLAWDIKAMHLAVGGVVWRLAEFAAQQMEVARREPDPVTRAPFLAEFDRLMQLAALWRRFIP